jgi:lysozyme family protein
MSKNYKPSLELLFSQLGLANSAAAIELYVRTHQLPAGVPLHDAPFWNRSQRDFLISHLVQDDDWAIWIDELNQQLHLDAYKLQTV